jgi:hypothetical protein
MHPSSVSLSPGSWGISGPHFQQYESRIFHFRLALFGAGREVLLRDLREVPA